MKQTQLKKRDYYRQKAKERWSDPEFRKRMKSIMNDPITKKKQSISSKKLWKDEKRKKTMLENLNFQRKKLLKDDVHKQLISNKAKERWSDEKFKNKMKSINQSSEVKKKRSKSMIKKWKEDKEYRKKTTKGIHKAMAKPEYRKKLSEALSMEKNPRWRGGKSFEPYGTDFNKHLKKQIRNKSGLTCIVCHKHENSMKERLHCHHIDYDKTNNSSENFVALCRKCHSKTNSRRNYWIDLFRIRNKN